MEDNKPTLLFILGSHRAGGNIDKLQEIVDGHESRELFTPKFIKLRDKKIGYCRSCYKCTEVGSCVQDDDMEYIVAQMIESDVIVFVPVVYAFGTNSIFQTFLERAGYGYLRPQGRPLKHKLALVTVIGRRYSHEAVASQIISNILLNEMILIGSGFIPLLHGQTFPGEIQYDKEGIDSFNRSISYVVNYLYNQKGALVYENPAN